MPKKILKPAPNLGRKSAYVARNRVALIKAAQGVLADLGPETTIERVAEVAEVSVSTIYKHFESKELLFETAIVEAMLDWEVWIDEIVADVQDPLEALALPMRMLLRIKSTHPLYANLIAKNLSDIPRYFPVLSNNLGIHIKALVKSKAIDIDNIEIRIQSFSGAHFAALSQQLLNPKAREVDADIAIEIALGILGLTPAKAKKLAHMPLPTLKI